MNQNPATKYPNQDNKLISILHNLSNQENVTAKKKEDLPTIQQAPKKIEENNIKVITPSSVNAINNKQPSPAIRLNTIEPRQRNKHTAFFVIVFLILAFLSFAYYNDIGYKNLASLFFKPSNNTKALKVPNRVTNANASDISSFNIDKKYINCEIVYKVIPRNDNYYLVCNGGIIVLSDNFEVTQQISKSDGLSAERPTDLAVENNILYIGTDIGLNIYDLELKDFTLIDDLSGLPDKNVKFVLVSNNLIWVVTPKGLYSLDKSTLKLVDNITSLNNFNITSIIIESEIIYATYQEPETNQTGVFTLDLNTKKETVYNESKFNVKPSKLIDIAIVSIDLNNKNIFVATDKNEIFNAKINQSEVIGNVEFIKDTEFAKQNSNLKDFKFIGTSFDKLIVKTDIDIKLYDVNLKKYLSTELSVSENQIIENLENSYFINLNRPKSFSKIIFGFNDNIIVDNKTSVYNYNLTEKSFKKLFDYTNSNSKITINPILSSKDLLIVLEVCNLDNCNLDKIYKLNTDNIDIIDTNLIPKISSEYTRVDTLDSNSIVFVKDYDKDSTTDLSGISINLSVPLTATQVNNIKIANITDTSSVCNNDLSFIDNTINYNVAPVFKDGSIKYCDFDMINKDKFLSTYDFEELTNYYIFYSQTSSKYAFITGSGLNIYSK